MKKIIDSHVKTGHRSSPDLEVNKAAGVSMPVLLRVSRPGCLATNRHDHSCPMKCKRLARRRRRWHLPCDDNEIPPASSSIVTPSRFVWTPQWNQLFSEAVGHLGGPNQAKTSGVYEILRKQTGDSGLKYADVSSHLAVFRSLHGGKPTSTTHIQGPAQSDSQPAGSSGSNCGAVDGMMNDLCRSIMDMRLDRVEFLRTVFAYPSLFETANQKTMGYFV